ncbi:MULTISPECIES: DUF2207 domain-containing protein [unclassified Wenzhouxiangella]|uniref:DUF2207 domain-containing protein n=1 Tax=unclassified Wenzhouxiangella TaxID=2613841 RepID=UPI000E326C5F|nr:MULTISPECIES: DUF2207 domain-containing protein [unclassified Wenzhouxiangella]RFF27692.1 DUF2207 domain-containing protein [Wenzhouxiangella sp. 15181]RFP69783.1 DUF2207 domain-containing protein [Wenzhouxiangella sp. 15190]
MKRILCALLLLPLTAVSEERIVEFASEIEVKPSRELAVTENITIVAEGRDIRRGIYRDFPTRYEDRNGKRVTVPFDVVSVRRNGQREDWHTESISNGVRLYFGSAKRMLDHGEHRYELTYRTERQIGFFEDFDELYWNVTGHAWDFPIERATVVVNLPSGAAPDELRLDAYTGRQGEQGDEAVGEVVSGSRVRFETTRRLAPREGLTISVGFPKGLVREPTAAEELEMDLQDHRLAVIGALGTLIAVLWYLFAWTRVGRDPEGGAIYPRYDPPEGYSPGMLRYVWKMGYDRTCLAAALVSLAVKGAIRLDKKDDDYVAERLDGETESATERKLLGKLLDQEGEKITFKQSNHAEIRAALKAHEKALSGRMEGRYFQLNRWWVIPGILISVATLVAMVLSLPGEDKFVAGFLALHQTIWNIGTAVLMMRVYRTWRDLKDVTGVIGAILLTAFSLPFLIASIVVLGIFGQMIGWLPALIVVIIGIVNGLFWSWMRAPTMRGRQLLDEVEGLRLYLTVAEREDIERRHGDAPPQTFEEFERLLPYAVALDAADTWAERFASEIEAAAQAGTAQSRSWYPATLSDGRFTAAGLGTALGSSLASATASASTAPGSSSGGGGGGFSGGGGGGGGGGGW